MVKCNKDRKNMCTTSKETIGNGENWNCYLTLKSCNTKMTTVNEIKIYWHTYNVENRLCTITISIVVLISITFLNFDDTFLPCNDIISHRFQERMYLKS